MQKEPIRLTSRKSPIVIETAKLQDKKYRKQTNSFLAEGAKLFWEARKTSAPILRIFATEQMYAELFAQNAFLDLDCPIYVVTASIFEKISTEKSPQGVLCVIKDIDFFHKRYIIYGRDSFTHSKIILCDIQDPGNLGTMIRTANAFGIEEVLLSGNCADLYHPRTVRAAMGALFRQPISVCEQIEPSILLLRQKGYTLCAATLQRDSVPLPNLSCNSKACFVIGNEGHGLPQEIIAVCDRSVIIPMQENSESLNAATAAAIFMWETVRHNDI